MNQLHRLSRSGVRHEKKGNNDCNDDAKEFRHHFSPFFMCTHVCVHHYQRCKPGNGYLAKDGTSVVCVDWTRTSNARLAMSCFIDLWKLVHIKWAQRKASSMCHLGSKPNVFLRQTPLLVNAFKKSRVKMLFWNHQLVRAFMFATFFWRFMDRLYSIWTEFSGLVLWMTKVKEYRGIPCNGPLVSRFVYDHVSLTCLLAEEAKNRMV